MHFNRSSIESYTYSSYPFTFYVSCVQVEEGWWEGVLNGKTGMFPSNFIKDVGSETEIGANFEDHQIKQGKTILLNVH